MRMRHGLAVAGCAVAMFVQVGCDAPGNPPRAKTLFVLGDSYTALSAPHLMKVAKEAGCDLSTDTRFARPGWTARMFLSIEDRWTPALRAAAQPVVIYLTLGFNDMGGAVESRRTPKEAAVDLEKLIERLLAPIRDNGGRIVQVGYDDPCQSAGAACRNPSESQRLSDFYGSLPPEGPDYRLEDVRGWLGDSLGTEDGIHMTDQNYRDQAALLWERTFASEFGCRVTK